MRIANTVNDSIVDGHGLRFTVFTQGCPHHCPGCHNPGTHDAAGGREATLEELVEQMKKNPLIEGITLSGGEPFVQAAACADLARAAHGLGLNVWTYTGYLFEHLRDAGDPAWTALLAETDVLVDGPFLQKEKSYELHFRGSRNQRLIDVPASLAQGKVVLWEEEDLLAYVRTPEPYDKAGAYAIQGHAALWCAGIAGCYYNIMGLPVHRTAQLLRRFG